MVEVCDLHQVFDQVPWFLPAQKTSLEHQEELAQAAHLEHRVVVVLPCQ